MNIEAEQLLRDARAVLDRFRVTCCGDDEDNDYDVIAICDRIDAALAARGRVVKLVATDTLQTKDGFA